jgi:ArsR family metal-binding transcriptional regulator
MKSDKPKLSVGQTVWVKSRLRVFSNSNPPVEATITKVGKKYFTVDILPNTQFHIENLQQVSDSTAYRRCYLSLQEIHDEQEYHISLENIRKYIGSYGMPELTLDQLRKIMDIINNTPVESN